MQFPEGLLLHSTLIADIITQFCSEKSVEGSIPVECLILGDVTYGACCIDDLASKKLDCDFIVHYGHSWQDMDTYIRMINIKKAMQ